MTERLPEGALLAFAVGNRWVPVVVVRRQSRGRLLVAWFFDAVPVLNPAAWRMPNQKEAWLRCMTHNGALLDGSWKNLGKASGFDRSLHVENRFWIPAAGGRRDVVVCDDANPGKVVQTQPADSHDLNIPSFDLLDPWLIAENARAAP